MTIHQRMAAGFLAAAIILVAHAPDHLSSAVAVVACTLLYAFTIFCEKRVDTHNADLELRLKLFSERIQNIELKNGFGR